MGLGLASGCTGCSAGSGGGVLSATGLGEARLGVLTPTEAAVGAGGAAGVHAARNSTSTLVSGHTSLTRDSVGERRRH
jgi:hypothetical protein